jgi:hypothetical protein
MTVWTNSDGLKVRFGLDQAVKSVVGKPTVAGEKQQLVITINGVDVPSTDAPIEYPAPGIPQGATIVSATLFVTTAFTSGGSATLDVGLIADDGDNTFTTEDDDGLLSAIAVATLADGAQVTMDGAYATTQVGTETHGRDYLVSYGYNTEAFTAGVGKLVIEYIKN